MVHSAALMPLVAVACTAAAILMTELALTRIFSVVMYYHFAFLAISIALFGLSASGVFAYQAPLALYSGVVAVDPTAPPRSSFDIPAFAGTVRVMAVAWSKDKVGRAVGDVIVRDPVVLTATLPRFLLTGDRGRVSKSTTSRARRATTASTVRRRRAARRGDAGADPAAGRQAAQQTVAAAHRLRAGTARHGADHRAERVRPERSYALGAKPATQVLTRRTVKPLAKGESLTLSNDLFADLVPGTGGVALSVGPSTALDAATLLKALDRYPFGCSEQIASRALPLLYVNELAAKPHLALDTAVDQRIRDAIDRLLARQGSNGSFGLWSAGGDDVWLDAYVTDFLTRARERGFAVPDTAFKLALDRLRNFVSNAPDPCEGRRPRSRLCALRAGAQRRRAGRRPALSRRRQARRARDADRQGADRRGARHARRPRARRARLCGGARQLNPPRSRSSIRPRRLRLGAARCGGAGDARVRRRRARGRPSRARCSASSRRARSRPTPRRRSRPGWCSPRARWRRTPARCRSTSTASRARARSTATVRASELDAAVHGHQHRREHRAGRGVGHRRAARRRSPRPRRASRSSGSTTRSTASPPIRRKAKQNQRFAVVLKITEPQPQFGRMIVADYLPAGFEIDNPRLVSSGDTGTLSWIEDAEEPVHSEFRDDRFSAAFERKARDQSVFTVAYVVRAVSPGRYVLPQAYVEDMYRPDRFGRTGTGTIEVDGGEVTHRDERAIEPPSHRSCCAIAAAEVVSQRRGARLARALAVRDSLGPRAARRGARLFDAGGRPRGPAAAALRHAARAAGGCRPRSTSVDPRYHRHAARLRGPALPLASRRRSAGARRARRCSSSPAAASSRAARPSPCRWRGCWSRAPSARFAAKLRQIVRAIQLERALSKDEILALYLSLAPYGGNLEGMRAASLAYFGKEPRRLTLGEAALLVALPQSPELRRPDRSARAARARARPRARPRRGGRTAFRADEVARGQARAGAGRPQADADAGAARRRRRRSPPRRRASIHRLTIDARAAEEPARTWRASARARSGPTFRSRSSRSTMRPARCSRASPRPTISTSAAPARST